MDNVWSLKAGSSSGRNFITVGDCPFLILTHKINELYVKTLNTALMKLFTVGVFFSWVAFFSWFCHKIILDVKSNPTENIAYKSIFSSLKLNISIFSTVRPSLCFEYNFKIKMFRSYKNSPLLELLPVIFQVVGGFQTFRKWASTVSKRLTLLIFPVAVPIYKASI